MLTDIHSHHITPQSDRKLISCSMPGIGSGEWEKARYVSLSLHPWYLTEDNLNVQLEWIRTNIHDPRVLAVGEAGLDKICSTPFGLQLNAFRCAISLSEQHRLPLIIHCVRAYNEILDIRKETKPEQPWIIHGFRGKKEVMQMLVRHGLYLSFGERYQETSLQQIPADRLLVETDESPIEVERLYHLMAQSRGTDAETFTEKIQDNIRRLFPGLK